MQSERLGSRGELRVHDARLDDGEAVGAIDAHDPVQSRQHDEHRTLVGERTARQSRSSAPRDERHVERGEQAHDGDQFFASARENDEVGNAAVRRQSIHRVRHARCERFAHVLCANNGGEVAGKWTGRGHTI